MTRSRNPGEQAPRFGLFRFRSPLLTESLLFSSPPATEMFHFAGCRARALSCSCMSSARRHWVAPFGNLGIKDRMRLPQAYRSLPRPSSPAAAKASAIRPYSLDA